MDQRAVSSGTHMYFGAPAVPMPKSRSRAIAQVVAQIDGIMEAHLPQFYMDGDEKPRQILAIGVEHMAEVPRIIEDLNARLVSVLPKGRFIDILPFEARSFPDEVRKARCKIHGKAWWKVW